MYKRLSGDIELESVCLRCQIEIRYHKEWQGLGKLWRVYEIKYRCTGI